VVVNTWRDYAAKKKAEAEVEKSKNGEGVEGEAGEEKEDRKGLAKATKGTARKGKVEEDEDSEDNEGEKKTLAELEDPDERTKSFRKTFVKRYCVLLPPFSVLPSLFIPSDASQRRYFFAGTDRAAEFGEYVLYELRGASSCCLSARERLFYFTRSSHEVNFRLISYITFISS
jgi:hypothetical protein